MLRDLRFYYGIDLVDVIQGRGPCPFFVLELLRGVPDDGLMAALMRGGYEHLGWGMDRYISTNIYDAVNANTRATGNWGKKPPKIEPHYRPKTGKDVNKAEKKPTSLKDLHASLSAPRR